MTARMFKHQQFWDAMVMRFVASILYFDPFHSHPRIVDALRSEMVSEIDSRTTVV